MRNCMYVFILCMAWGIAGAELKAPPVDVSEKPGQRALENINRKATEAASPKAKDASTGRNVGVGTLVAKTFLGLAFIIVLIVILVYLMKKLQGGRFNKLSQKSDMEILESISIGQHQRIITVKIQSQILVLGATQHTINTLTSLTGADADAYLYEVHKFGVTANQFSETVNTLLGKFKKPEGATESARGEKE